MKKHYNKFYMVPLLLGVLFSSIAIGGGYYNQGDPYNSEDEYDNRDREKGRGSYNNSGRGYRPVQQAPQPQNMDVKNGEKTQMRLQEEMNRIIQLGIKEFGYRLRGMNSIEFQTIKAKFFDKKLSWGPAYALSIVGMHGFYLKREYSAIIIFLLEGVTIGLCALWKSPGLQEAFELSEKTQEILPIVFGSFAVITGISLISTWINMPKLVYDANKDILEELLIEMYY